ncbi:MAG: hypothetical protein NTX03_09590 [Bacteroidetes bacterium]|nr:hypothetical protein [Bacteroidota bacterium]
MIEKLKGSRIIDLRGVVFYFVFFSFLTTICTCTKKEEVTKLDPNFLAYFAFPKGSWWVYKETHIGDIDSFYVSYYDRKIIKDSKYSYNYEALYYEIYSKNDTSYGTAFPHDKQNTMGEYWITYGVGHIYRFVYPFTQKDSIGVEVNKFYIPEYFDTITIQHKLYSNVYRTENKHQSVGNKIKSEFYCKNVGVIKRINFDGTEWELIRYHLN